MSWKIPTSFVTRSHPYTSVDVPWQMDDTGASSLFRYLRGGGSRAFGSSSLAEMRSRRQLRFLWIFGAISALYAVLWVV